MSLDQKIERSVALLNAGEDPETVLRAFAKSVGEGQTVERMVEQKVCAGCGDQDALCFLCRVKETVGEQAILAAPFVLPKIMELGKEAITELARRRAQAKAAKQEANQEQPTYGWPPPPPPGKQEF